VGCALASGADRTVCRRFGLFLRGDDPLELVEAVRPTVAVKRAAILGLERALRESNLRRFAASPERQADLGLDIVGIWVLVNEGVSEAGWRVDFAELAGQIEVVAVRR